MSPRHHRLEGENNVPLFLIFFSENRRSKSDWAPNFSEENFSKVKIGISSDEVLALMGKPLYTSENCVDGCFWHYTKQDSGTSDYDQRWVIFDSGYKVVEIRKSFFID